MPDDEDDADVFPPISGDFFESPKGSSTSSKLDQEMLLELEVRKSKALKKKQSGSKVTKADHPTKSKKAWKKKSSGKPVSARTRSVAFGSEELLHVSKAFMMPNTQQIRRRTSFEMKYISCSRRLLPVPIK
jgi:hypothetical protein